MRDIEESIGEIIQRTDVNEIGAAVTAGVLVVRYLIESDIRKKVTTTEYGMSEIEGILKKVGVHDLKPRAVEAVWRYVEVVLDYAGKDFSAAKFMLGRSALPKRDYEKILPLFESMPRPEEIMAGMRVLCYLVRGQYTWFDLVGCLREYDELNVCAAMKNCFIWPEEGVLERVVELFGSL